MTQLNEIIKLIKFPFNLKEKDFYKENLRNNILVSESEKIFLNGNFIEYYQYKKRTNGEKWISIDIYIKYEKIEEVMKILHNYSKENDTFKTISDKKFEESENNYVFYSLENDRKIRLDVLKYENKLVFLLTQFL
jgi:Ni,Fe-hydrogenase III component G